jgi:hypothetical protein
VVSRGEAAAAAAAASAVAVPKDEMNEQEKLQSFYANPRAQNHGVQHH